MYYRCTNPAYLLFCCFDCLLRSSTECTVGKPPMPLSRTIVFYHPRGENATVFCRFLRGWRNLPNANLRMVRLVFLRAFCYDVENEVRQCCGFMRRIYARLQLIRSRRLRCFQMHAARARKRAGMRKRALASSARGCCCALYWARMWPRGFAEAYTESRRFRTDRNSACHMAAALPSLSSATRRLARTRRDLIERLMRCIWSGF